MVYIPQQKILTRLQRYKALNETRLQRALALMTPEARSCLNVVPVLLHYNHINLPSYRQGYIPHGIDLFTPNEEQRRYINEILLPSAPPLEEPKDHAILGLYAMGSISSVGQSDTSDIDIWVCVKANISAEGMLALQDKCRFITTYIKSQGVELNLFVTPEDRFTTFTPDSLDRENCGSAQNIFLLDEFYRSSIRICGRYIIWYMISTSEEQSDYDAYVDFLLKGISGIPAERLPRKAKKQQQKKKSLKLSPTQSVSSTESSALAPVTTQLEVSNALSAGIEHQLHSSRPVAASAFVQGELCSQLSPLDVVPTMGGGGNAYGMQVRSDNTPASSLELLGGDHELGFAVDFYPDSIIEPHAEESLVPWSKEKLEEDKLATEAREATETSESTMLSPERFSAFKKFSAALSNEPLSRDQAIAAEYAAAIEQADNADLALPLEQDTVAIDESVATTTTNSPVAVTTETKAKFSGESEPLLTKVSVSTTVTMTPTIISTITSSTQGDYQAVQSALVHEPSATLSLDGSAGVEPDVSLSVGTVPDDIALQTATPETTVVIETELAEKEGDKEAKQLGRLKILHTARELIKNSGVRQYVPYLLATNSDLPSQEGTPLVQAVIAAAGATSHDTSVSITDQHLLPATTMVVNQQNSTLGTVPSNTHSFNQDLGLTLQLSIPQGEYHSADIAVVRDAELWHGTTKQTDVQTDVQTGVTSSVQVATAATPIKSIVTTSVTTTTSTATTTTTTTTTTSVTSNNASENDITVTQKQDREQRNAQQHNVQKYGLAKAHVLTHEVPRMQEAQGKHGVQGQVLELTVNEVVSHGDNDLAYFPRYYHGGNGISSLGAHSLGHLSSRNVQHGHKTWCVQQQTGIVGLSGGWRKEAEFTVGDVIAHKGRDAHALGKAARSVVLDGYDEAHGDGDAEECSVMLLEDKTDQGANRILSLEESIAAAQQDGWEELVAPLQADEWFDFGTVVKSSPTEYFGSGLWLLYKAIDSPFKVVLKILLMEAYSSDYPNTKLLSSELKDYMHSHDGYSLDLDSYYLMYLKVSNYLQQLYEKTLVQEEEDAVRLKSVDFRSGSSLSAANVLSPVVIPHHVVYEGLTVTARGRRDASGLGSSAMVHYNRLQLMRKCFYLKIFNGLNHKDAAYAEDYKLKRELLDKFALRWGNTPSFVKELESIGSWKMQAVNDFNQEVYNTILESYMSLLRFSVRHGIEYAITSDDAGILSRKLYAAFDRYPSKIPVLHSSFKHNLEESFLTFIHPSDYSLCRKGWHLYTAAPNDVALLSTKVSYIGSRLSEVVTWACFNRLMTPRSRTFVVGSAPKEISLKIKQLSRDIQRVLGPYLDRTNEQALLEAQQMQACVVVLNLEQDDTDLLRNNLMDIGNSSTLCLGRQRICLVESVDLIFINNWGEIRSMSFPDGEEGVVELLATLLRMLSNNTAACENVSVSALLSKIEVCSYASAYQDLLKYDLESIMRQVFNCLNKGSSSEFVFEVGRNNYIARARGERGVVIQRDGGFGSNEFDISVLSRYGMRPEFALQVPPIVDRYASAGIVQYFFAPKEQHEHWDIYILNERNEVRIYKDYFGSRATLVNAINRFYTSQSQSRALNAIRFNLPQYFVLSNDQKALHPFTIKNM